MGEPGGVVGLLGHFLRAWEIQGRIANDKGLGLAVVGFNSGWSVYPPSVCFPNTMTLWGGVQDRSRPNPYAKLKAVD